MSRRFVPIAILLPLVLMLVISLAALGAASESVHGPVARTTRARAGQPQPHVTVHEWGTFTSVAGPDGKAIGWQPLDGPDDLPCFVERYQYNNKGTLPGTVRMETPVLYFYSPDDMTVDVNVGFRQGAITEWYPRADVTPRIISGGESIRRSTFVSTAAWTNVRIAPGNLTPAFRTESGTSHYYRARDTDAAPVQIGEQQEKFLFYRGIGGFQPPISAAVGSDGTVQVKSPMGAPLGDLILFENRGGKVAYQVQAIAEGEATLTPPTLAETSAPPTTTAGTARTSLAPSKGAATPLSNAQGLPTAELERILIAHGLFPREAKAMVETWRDSWFEEGARLLYIAPRSAIDAILPLRIRPAPIETARVFVGRMELITARTEEDVRRALAAKNTPALAKYGRFLSPIAWQILEPMSEAERARLAPALNPFYQAQFEARIARCKPTAPPLATH